MTDDRNTGGPPAPGPAAPPPLASTPQAPPPIAAAPVPAPAYAPPPAPAPYQAPPPARGGAGLWPLFTVLAFLVGVGGTILTLWLSGELWNSSSSSHARPGTGLSGPTGPSPAIPAPAPAPTPGPAPYSGSMPTASTLAGTWGPNCPGSRNEAITFYADGTASGDGESGSWSLNGNYVSLNNGRETMSVYWEMADANSARVRRSGDDETRTIYRCP